MRYTVEGNIVNIIDRSICKGAISVENGIIVEIDYHSVASDNFIMPGFVDAHLHIESTMLTPQNFGELALLRGTMAMVADPHEIANVMGRQGIEFMIESSKKSPIKMFFTIPSCVPVCSFDVSGGVVTADDVEQMAASGRFVALSEVMDINGVITEDKDVMAKIASAKKHGIPIDGHVPVLDTKHLEDYISKGISTDHESLSLTDALDKIRLGMKILIREGSAAHNYEALKSLIHTHPDDVMFCTDDSHPDDIADIGHIDKFVVWSVANGYDLFDVLRIASLNPIRHYKLDVGLLRVGDKADFIVVDNLKSFNVKQVFVDGIPKIGTREYIPQAIEKINIFNHSRVDITSLRKAVLDSIKVISIIDNELLTNIAEYSPLQPTDNLESDMENDIAKIVYINRYNNGVPQVAFCKGFNLKRGAFASSISHDSHNIIAVGCSDDELLQSINAIIDSNGGLSVCCNGTTHLLPLSIGGIMSDKKWQDVADDYKKMSQIALHTGCKSHSPFMTLSFMALLVIPEIKIGEKGLFCVSKFNWLDDK